MSFLCLQINDDTLMKSPGWTQNFIEALSQFKPAHVGVVGPSEGTGKQGMLTYDFVHRYVYVHVLVLEILSQDNLLKYIFHFYILNTIIYNISFSKDPLCL